VKLRRKGLRGLGKRGTKEGEDAKVGAHVICQKVQQSGRRGPGRHENAVESREGNIGHKERHDGENAERETGGGTWRRSEEKKGGKSSEIVETSRNHLHWGMRD